VFAVCGFFAVALRVRNGRGGHDVRARDDVRSRDDGRARDIRGPAAGDDGGRDDGGADSPGDLGRL
jgi:hypothetical protein